MKTGLIIGIIVLIVIVLGALVFILMNNPSTQGNTQTNKPSSGNNQPSTPKTYNIEIKNFAFSPASLTINKGDTVIWTNKDSVPHTVTSDLGNELDSPVFGNGKTYSHTFTNSGNFNYYCTIHPMMKAEIIVK